MSLYEIFHNVRLERGRQHIKKNPSGAVPTVFQSLLSIYCVQASCQCWGTQMGRRVPDFTSLTVVRAPGGLERGIFLSDRTSDGLWSPANSATAFRFMASVRMSKGGAFCGEESLRRGGEPTPEHMLLAAHCWKRGGGNHALQTPRWRRASGERGG